MGNLSFDECARYSSISQSHHVKLAQSEPIHHWDLFTLFRYRFNLSPTGATQLKRKQFSRID